MFQPKTTSGLLAIALWLCAAGACWVLLSPAALHRRTLTERVTETRADRLREWMRGVWLERVRDGLQGDPSVIEKEARRLGYGRPREYAYPLSPRERQAADRSLSAASVAAHPDPWPAVRHSLAPALMLIIACAIAILFFTDLRVEDPGPQPLPRHQGDPE